MKIFIVSQYFYPENFRINDIVRELVKRGHSITVLTDLPNYPEGEIYEGYEEAYKKVSDYCGAKVYRCKLRPRHKGLLDLALNYHSFVKEAKKTLKTIEPNFDVLYFYEPSPITSGLPVIWYGKKHNIKTVIYNMDIWPDCVRDTRNEKVMSKINPIYLLSKHWSKKVYKGFDLIINKCDEFGDYLNSMFKTPHNKMITLYEHAENTYLSVSEKPIDNGIIDFMFLGNIGKAQNCDQMVEAFSKINNSNSIFHFVGDGSYLTELKSLVDRLNLKDKVIFHGKQSVEEVIKYYNLADVCVLALSNKTVSGLTPPGKLFSYLAAARPIVASINGPTASIIKEAECGYVSDADCVDSLANSMQAFIDGYDKKNSFGIKARKKFLESFTLESHINSLEIILRDLATQ